MSADKESLKTSAAKRESSRSRIKPSSTSDVANDTKEPASKRVSSRDKPSSKPRDTSVARSKLTTKTSDKSVVKPKLEPDKNTGNKDVAKTKETSSKRNETVIKVAKASAVKVSTTSSKSISKTISKTSSTSYKTSSVPSKVASKPSEAASWISAAGDQPKPSRGALHKEANITKESRNPSKRNSSHTPTTAASGSKDGDRLSRGRRLEERVSELDHARIRPRRPTEESKQDKVSDKHRREKEGARYVGDTSRNKTRPAQSETAIRDKVPSKTKRRPEESEEKEKKETVRRDKRETDEKKENPTRVRTRTRVLSPSEVKTASEMIPQIVHDASKVAGGGERNSGRTGHGFPMSVASTSRANAGAGDFQAAEQESGEESDDYEDDFEDYKSDFEEDSSGEDAGDGDDDDGASALSDKDDSVLPELNTRQQPNMDEEKKMDSGNYDMAENQRRSKLHLREIREAMLNENLALTRERDSDNVAAPSPVDEGYEEGKSDEMKNTVSQPLNFINFAQARKRQKEQKVSAVARKRGEELLSMISLDVMHYKLFEMAPVAYDVFMATYGRSNGVQASVQTNEDNLAEETQTDDVATADRWTQKPVAFQTRGESAVKSTIQQDRLGVGCTSDGDDVNPASTSSQPRYDPGSLERFISTAGALMLRVLQEESSRHGVLKKNKVDIEFSKGHVSLAVATLPFLVDRSVTIVRYAAQQPMTLLTVHKSNVQQTSAGDASLGRCIVCVWDVADPTTPQAVLAAWHDVTAACFDSSRARLVVAGLHDGSLCVWDLRERSASHEQVNEEGNKWLLRSPTYSTAEVLKAEGHMGRVVSIQPLIDVDVLAGSEYAPTQVCSMEESGVVIIWTVIQSLEHGMKSGASQQDLGMAHWGRVRLVKTSSVSLADNIPVDQLLLPNLLFSDLQLNSDDCDHLFVSSNTGHVMHGLKSGAKPIPRLYHSKSDEITFANCIETFPFGHSLFLVGCGDGSVRLHRRESENPLTTLAGTGDAPGQGPIIRALQWSRSRPTIFFVLDDISRIHVWDLGRSDMYPRYTATLTDADVTAIQLAPDPRDGKTTPQMAIATARGTVEIHDLKDEYKYKSSSEMARELNNFIRFTNIL